MKYCRLQTSQGAQYAEVVDRAGRLWIERLIPPFEEGPASDFVDPVKDRFDPLPLDEASLLAPVAPSKIVCIGRNYREHAAELGNEVPAEPLLSSRRPQFCHRVRQSASRSSQNASISKVRSRS
jgi:2-keto-4-pentenoate hydratase/2-oxohepta-3-ene-1,7-dioic acid hydratase in catechol pathway